MSLLPSSSDSSPSEDAEPRVVDVESDEADDVFAALSSGTARKLLTELHENPSPPAALAEHVDTSIQNVQYHLEKLEDAGAIEVVDTAYSEKGREMNIYAPADRPLVIFAGNEKEESTLRAALSRLLGSLGLLAFASVLVQAVFGEKLLPFGADGEDDEATDDGAGVGAEETDDAKEEAPEDDTSEYDESDDVPETADEADDRDVSEDAEDEDVDDVEDGPDDADDADPSELDAETADELGENTSQTAPDSSVPPEGTENAGEVVASLPPGVAFFAGGVFVLCLVALAVYFQHHR